MSDNSGAGVFTSSAPGKFSITATVSISAKLGEAGQHQLDRDRSLTVTTVVTVTERLQITNLAAEARAAALLLAPGSSYQLRSNKNSRTPKWPRWQDDCGQCHGAGPAQR